MPAQNPAAVNPIRALSQSTDRESDRTSSASPGASHSRATPNFSRPLPLSPGTAAPPNASPPGTAQIVDPGASFSRPLPSVPGAPSRQSLEHTHDGRGSGLGTRIIDDRDDPDDDLIIPGPTLRQPQSRSPVQSYEDSRRTSSVATESDLLYASAPSTPLRIPVELGQEVNKGHPSPPGSQTTHETARRGLPDRRTTVTGGETHRAPGEGSVTPRRAATTDHYGPAHPQGKIPVPQLPKAPETSEQDDTDDLQDALEYSDDIDPYLRKLVDNFGNDTPKFAELFPHEQTTDAPSFPEPQNRPHPFVLGVPISDTPQTPSSPQSDNETVRMSVPSAIAFPFQGQHESAWKSYASSSLHGGPAFSDHFRSSDMSQYPSLSPPVIAGTNLEFEPLQSPHEQDDLTALPTPHAGTSSYAHDHPTNATTDLPYSHIHRPLPPYPSTSSPVGQEGAGKLHGNESNFHSSPRANNGAPVSPTAISPVAPLRITKHARTPSSTTPIPPGAAAPTPPASSSPDTPRTRQTMALPISGSPSSQGQQLPPYTSDPTSPFPESPATAGITSAKEGSQSDIQKANSGVHSNFPGPSTYAKPDPPKPTIKKNTASDDISSRAQDQSAIPSTSVKATRKESEGSHLAPNEEVRRAAIDSRLRKPSDTRTRTAAHPDVSPTHAHEGHSVSQSHSQPQNERPQEHRPGPLVSNSPPAQQKPLLPPQVSSKPQPQPQPQRQPDSTADPPPSGPRKRTSRADTPSTQPQTLAEEKAQYNAIPPSSRSQYMHMLLALDDIPMIYDLSASFFTWILLAGFILFPGTFTSLQTLNLGNGVGATVVDSIVNLPLFIVAFICTGIGVIGMGYLWWKWMKNYIWLTNKIFIPGLMNSLAGIISTLANVYGVQHGEFNTTSTITISVTGVVGARRHAKEMGIQKAGKHGEGVWAGFKEQPERVVRASHVSSSARSFAPKLPYPCQSAFRKMRDRGVFNFKRALPRMSWSPQNLYNLWHRTVGPKSRGLDFRYSPAKETLFQQRWLSKKLVRAYHGDYIGEKLFTRWYLPETIPDVRPRRAVKTGDDEASLAEYARRKSRSEESEQAIEQKGMPPVGSLMFSEVERRIDTVVFRCCFAESVYEARRLVIHGNVFLNGKKHQNPNTRLAPGDMISVEPSAVRFLKPNALPDKEYEDVNGYNKLENPDPNQHTPFFLPHFASPHLFIPAYIEPSFSTCSAIYVRHPTARPGYSEIPTPYDADGAVVRYAWEWYVKRRPRIRSASQLARMPEDRAITLGLVDKESLIKQDRTKLREDIKKMAALQRK
ncbi:hypothetical protein D9756_007107 [Leucocoprinus leucothites]|uniref:RNA-binding S4 domain-containing protein n=1 Tax=Leucocoprinus leucothites TaxID=201217 RepID=A0A8H5FYR3_9AGAR|nr:hypothetical protein D9756_007107 [Leucoagaricus leucothites]